MKRSLDIRDGVSVTSALKRQVVEVSPDGSMDGEYKFKILLPNGTSVVIMIKNPIYKMPIGDFIGLIKEEYVRAKQKLPSWREKPPIKWKSNEVYLEDTNNNKIRMEVRFRNFKPNKYHILSLHDGSDCANTFENMWDLTPDTELLRELPEEYTLETALADLIDNSLQAVWASPGDARRLISVDISDDKISILDTGPGMDGSEENSIVKWGKMGASLHRAYKGQAIGGKPPYLMPFFGLFGYGGPIASMHLGRRCIISSKTTNSKKVYVLHLEREALLKSSGSEYTWRTRGGIRNPSEDENARSTQGSFTKVEIFEPKMKKVNIFQLQCKLKDIYFPYIQCDEMSKSGKTNRPIEFQVDGVDLAEIDSSEVAITNLHSSNGPDFDLQLRFSIYQRSPGPGKAQEANARLRCVYFPIVKGKENIERILEILEEKGCLTERSGSFGRVSIRRLGRLLPDARWECLPFMEPGPKRGDKALILKRCCKRVKCFIESDAGFNPTPSKTDLAQQNSFTTALRNLGRPLDASKEMNVEIHRAGKLLTLSQLEKEYHEWIFQMHNKYDEETDNGEDQPTYILNPANKKALGISSDVVRVHDSMKRKGHTWTRGQKIKILKGACAGFHNNNVYGTIEYFLLEGLPGDAGGDAQIIFRSIEVPEGRGCNLSTRKGNPCLDIYDSQSLPINVIDAGKLVAAENSEWNNQLNKRREKAPSFIELLTLEDCRELNIHGVLPDVASIPAGQEPPEQIVAVLRPANYSPSSASRSIHQRFIVRNNTKMSMEVKFSEDKDKSSEALLHAEGVAPSSHEEVHGLYVFALGSKIPRLFKKTGTYRFTFSIEDKNCANCKKEVVVHASPEAHKWKLIDCEIGLSFSITVGSIFPQLSIACYDKYGNRTAFPCTPEIMVKLHIGSGVICVSKCKTKLSSNKLTLSIQDILIESSVLDVIRPTYSATMVIGPPDELFSISIPFKLIPGHPHTISAQPPVLRYQLLPGSVIEDLKLEVFDINGNHVSNKMEVILNMEGLSIQDQHGSRRKVNDNGFIDLSGVLKVVAGHGENVSLSVSSEGKVLYSLQLQTMEDPRPASPIYVKPVFRAVAESLARFSTGNHIQCEEESTPQTPKNHISFLSNEIDVKPCIIDDENQARYSTGKHKLREEESTPLTPTNDFSFLSIVENKELEEEIFETGERIGLQEKVLKLLNDTKAEIAQSIIELDEEENYSTIRAESCASTLNMDLDCMFLQEETMDRIESSTQSAASVLCRLSRCREDSFVDDIIGVVALLGTVCSPDLSRILAKYLGEDQMLAVVCRSYETALCLEKHKENGEVDRGLALHAKAAELGASIDGHFLVICLDDIKSYTGHFEESSPQRLLALPDPTLPTGEPPQGFLGYTVNMVNIVSDHLEARNSRDQGLRETLFYRLFGELQVYDTRKNLHDARFSITHGAVSLDGGILRENGFISFGCWEPKICFPVEVPEDQLYPTPKSQEHAMLIEEKRAEYVSTIRSIESVRRVREKDKRKFKEKTEQHKQFMDLAEPLIKKFYKHSLSSQKVGSKSYLFPPGFVN